MGAETSVAIINRKNIADWYSNDRKILVTPSIFVVRTFLLTSLLIYQPKSVKWDQQTNTCPTYFHTQNI